MEKKLTLRAWLATWRRRRHVNGKCFDATEEGMSLFPELSFQVGCTAIRRDGPSTIRDFRGLVHCWLVTPMGEIVDATPHQYGVPQSGLEHWPFRVQPATWAELRSNEYNLLSHLGLGYPPPMFWYEKDVSPVAAWMEKATRWTRPETERLHPPSPLLELEQPGHGA